MKKFCLITLFQVAVFLICRNLIQAQVSDLTLYHNGKEISGNRGPVFYFYSLGDKIFYRKWGAPAIGGKKKVLLIIHGIGYHGSPYEKIMNYIENDSILVYAMDLRGHGLSGKAKGMFESNEKVLTDMDNMISIIRKDNQDSEIYLMGVSMGGIYALGDVIRDTLNTRLSGLILVGAALKIHMSQIIHIENFIHLYSFIFNPQKPVIYLDGKRLELSSGDPDFVNSRRNDSLSIHYVSKDYLSIIREMQKTCRKESLVDDIELPVLILHGGKDKITDLKGSYFLKKNMVNSRAELIIYPESNHSLFWDCDSAKVFEDIVHWVLKN